MVVLGEAKRTYDKYQTTKEAGKRKTKNFFRRVWEFIWPPTHFATTTTGTAPMSELVVPAEEIPTFPRDVDEALEEFEACKNQGEAARMTEGEKAKARSLFEIARERIKGKPPLRTEQGPMMSTKERWEMEKAEAKARAKGRHW